MTKRYGWNRDVKDTRDYKFTHNFKTETLPEHVDLRGKSMPAPL